MTTYRTKDFYLEEGEENSKPISVLVEPGTGHVELQVKNSSDSWTTLTNPEFTLDAEDLYVIERANRPEMLIVAVGNAKFAVTGA